MSPRPLLLRRAAALGLLAVLLGGVYLAAVAPMVAAWTGVGVDIEETRARLGRLSALAGTVEKLEAALAGRQAQTGEGPAHYQAASETLVAAQVQDRLKAAVERAGGGLTSVRVLPAGEDGPFHRVALRAQVEARLPALQQVLHELEASRPYLVLDNLSVRVPGGAEQADPVLSVQFDLMAFARITRP